MIKACTHIVICLFVCATIHVLSTKWKLFFMGNAALRLFKVRRLCEKKKKPTTCKWLRLICCQLFLLKLQPTQDHKQAKTPGGMATDVLLYFCFLLGYSMAHTCVTMTDKVIIVEWQFLFQGIYYRWNKQFYTALVVLKSLFPALLTGL